MATAVSRRKLSLGPGGPGQGQVQGDQVGPPPQGHPQVGQQDQASPRPGHAHAPDRQGRGRQRRQRPRRRPRQCGGRQVTRRYQLKRPVVIGVRWVEEKWAPRGALAGGLAGPDRSRRSQDVQGRGGTRAQPEGGRHGSDPTDAGGRLHRGGTGQVSLTPGWYWRCLCGWGIVWVAPALTL